MKSIWLILLLAFFSCTDEVNQPEEQGTKIVDGMTIKKLEMTQAFDLSDDYLVRKLNGLATDGREIVGWSLEDPVFFIDQERKIHQIGDRGEGPGDYNLIASMHFATNGVYLLCNRNRLTLYKDRQYASDFKIKGPARVTWPLFAGPGSDGFVVAEDFIILPTTMNGKIGEIATIYTHGGDAISVIQDPELTRPMLEMNPFAQRTFWSAHEDRIFALYPYFGWLLEVNDQFLIKKRHQLTSPQIEKYLHDYHLEDRAKAHTKRNIPLFFNFQIFEGRGYATTGDTLHEFNLDTGEVKAIFQMKVVDDSELAQIQTISLPFFVILDTGELIMGNGYHDRLVSTWLPGYEPGETNIPLKNLDL